MSGSFESVRWNACVHRLDLGLYSHPKEFLGNGVRTSVNSQGENPSTGNNFPQSRMQPATLYQTGQRGHILSTSYSGPRSVSRLARSYLDHLAAESTRDGWLLLACLTSQQHASVPQGRICADNFTCYHTEIEAADPTFYLTQSQYTDTGPGAWQGSHWSANL